MKKKLKHLFFTLVVIASFLVILPLESNAATTSGTCGTNLTWTLDDSGTLTISGNGEMTINSYAPWYSSRSSIKSVIINDGVTSIGYAAFGHCTVLTSITIPNSVTSVDRSAFADCTSIEKVNIFDIGAWCNIQFLQLDSNPFHNNNGKLYLNNQEITELVIPNTVTSIGNCAFCSYTALTSVTIPDSVTSIGGGAFCNCTGLTSINIPNGVTGIEEETFQGCTALTCINIPDGVITIGKYAFSGCTALTSITIPNSMDIIDEYAFSSCHGLTSVAIPCDTHSGWQFYNCTGLKSVTVLNGVASIGEYTFYNCTALTNVTIPYSLTGIFNNAFGGCSKLKTVYYKGFESNSIFYNNWSSILIDSGNSYLKDAQRIYVKSTATTVYDDGDSKSFYIEPINIANGNTVILALYSDDKLVEAQSKTYTGESISFTTNKDYKTAKVFVWNNLTDIMPICDVEIVK